MSAVLINGPQHSARFSELASRIYEGWVVAAVQHNALPQVEGTLEFFADKSCDAAAIFMTELRRRDVLTGERVHGQLPQDDVEGYEE